ncbi:MAG: HAMP domain-containing histidine kinase [Oscillospiraceae bacterium]|nr:HAMP domain-containing histidine kinase [Oscillospiraceae bacterium]MBP1556480.1 HAMP domain-containing histidine kinase [Oscillospiraceae bacterium]MBP1577188.1 HAMP domain-containing histidine kinase [Oscillospiraceae bacterium]
MKNKGSAGLWGAFVAIIFVSLAASSFVVTGLLINARRQGIIIFPQHRSLFPLMSFLLSGVIVGTVIFALMGRLIIGPMMKLSDSIKEIARGNFEVEINEKAGLAQVRTVAHDLKIMAQELKGTETLRNDFIADVSHEFKTPLASIEGYAALLQNSSLSEADKNEYAGLIIESTRQLSTLTSNILSLSKLENQEIVPMRRKFLLDEQLRQALVLLEPQWSAKEIELDIEMEEIEFFGSEELLMTVWLNLLGNAIKFTPEKGIVGVRLKEIEGGVEVVVFDNGIGISPQALSHVFDKFYQEDKTRGNKGNGLGLALVKRIVTLCSGEITPESEVGKGSKFTVFLPFESVKE